MKSVCPICAAALEFFERYPQRVCEDCAARLTDADGRPVRIGFGGRLFADDGARDRQAFVYIDGRRCRFEEDRFGRGIVVSLDEERR